jgi:RimJ/RimL family protein N-acetyltransferase
MASNNSGPAYRIVTERLVIRCWEPGDAQLLKDAIDANIDHLRPWMPWALEEPTSLQEKIDRLRQFRGKFDLDQDYVYGIFGSDENQVVGGTGLHLRAGEKAREIGYWIHRDFINQGLASEAAGALTRIAFEIDKMDRVEIHCAPNNYRSAAIPQKLGFEHEATLKRRLYNKQGEARDTMIWSIFADTYPGSPASDLECKAYDAAGRRLI